MIRYIFHERDYYTTQTTFGELFIDREHYCYTLEDTVRAYGIKVKRETAIPEYLTGYNVSTRWSNKFSREVLVLSNQPDKVSIKEGGICFDYIYTHGGNRHKDTEGCILIGYKRDVENKTISQTAESSLFWMIKQWLADGDTVKWIIINKKQKN